MAFTGRDEIALIGMEHPAVPADKHLYPPVEDHAALVEGVGMAGILHVGSDLQHAHSEGGRMK